MARAPLEDLSVTKSAELESWLASAPVLEAELQSVARTYRASLSDLAALRIHPDLAADATLPAAGLPWFMAMFGRDTLITSLQTLPYLPGLAATTLRVLAARQATLRDDFHEREPGKILHELRFGELTARGELPYSPYYGTADATPLFLVLLDEYHRWSGDDALVRALEPNARAALDWISESGDLDGDGYVEYDRRNAATGLINQCWKDSWDSIQYADGTLAQQPDRNMRDPGLRLRRAAAVRPPRPRGMGRRSASRNNSRIARLHCARTSNVTSGCPSADITPSPSTATSARSTA